MYLRLDDFTLQGHGLNVSLGMKFEDEDASGDSSSTAKASKGDKGKRLDVKLFLRYAQADHLAELMAIAQARENGTRKVYTVTNDTANTAGMRQVRFTGDLRVKESDGLRQWEISFALTEYLSVPERAEARTADKSQAVQEHDGEIKAPPPEPEEALTDWEKNLKILNDAVAALGSPR